MATKLFYQCNYCGITEETTKDAECTKCGDKRKKVAKKQRTRSHINYYFTEEKEETKVELESQADLSEYLSRIYGGYAD